MLLYNLKEMECALEKSTNKNMEIHTSVTRLKTLLLSIDNKAEIVPESSYDKLVAVLGNLNGKPLSSLDKGILRAVIE